MLKEGVRSACKQIMIEMNQDDYGKDIDGESDERRVWRYENGNKNPWIEEEQTIQWPKQKVQKDKHGESCGDIDYEFLIKEKQCINEPNYMNIWFFVKKGTKTTNSWCWSN